MSRLKNRKQLMIGTCRIKELQRVRNGAGTADATRRDSTGA